MSEQATEATEATEVKRLQQELGEVTKRLEDVEQLALDAVQEVSKLQGRFEGMQATFLQGMEELRASFASQLDHLEQPEPTQPEPEPEPEPDEQPLAINTAVTVDGVGRLVTNVFGDGSIEVLGLNGQKQRVEAGGYSR